MRDDLEEEKVHEIEIEKDTNTDQLLDQQGIERQEVLVSRNGTIISGKHELEDGDKIKVFDVIAGG